MNDKQVVEMMMRCSEEIVMLRRIVDDLRPKAEAFDNLSIVLSLLPTRSQGMSEDIVWLLKKTIAEIEMKDCTDA